MLEAQVDTTLLNLQNNAGKTALHWAAYKGHVAIVDRLLDKVETEVNLQTRWGETALCTAVQENYLAIVVRLVRHPMVDLHVRNNHDETPFYKAVSEQKCEIGRVLLKADSSVMRHRPAHYAETHLREILSMKRAPKPK